MGVESSGPPERPKPPHVTEKLLLVEHALGILGEGDQEVELLRGELDDDAADADEARGQIDLEVADGQPRVARAGSAAEDRAHARDQLLVDEGPDHVVVGASRRSRARGRTGRRGS